MIYLSYNWYLLQSIHLSCVEFSSNMDPNNIFDIMPEELEPKKSRGVSQSTKRRLDRINKALRPEVIAAKLDNELLHNLGAGKRSAILDGC